MKKVRFIRSWQMYKVGAEIAPPAMLRDWLLRNHFVEYVLEDTLKSAEPVVPDTAKQKAVEQNTNKTATHRSPRRKYKKDTK